MFRSSYRAAVLVGAMLAFRLEAQPAPAFPNPSVTLDGKGITFYGTDSVSKVNLRFRVQELLSATSEGESDLGVRRTNLSVRRMRLRLEGTLKDPRLKVNVQLAFSRADMDIENTGIANVLRDAYLTWQFTPHLAGSFGQAKLPGNRQRLVSSSELQTPDRSPVNALFTVDRDVGGFLSYSNAIGRGRYVIRGAVTSGEGRNPAAGDGGLAYTTRWELLPFGAFTNGGDYVEGDLMRERSVKLSIAAGLSHNDRAARAGGQLGPTLFAARSMTTYFADALLKKRGVAISVEYAHRTAPDPITRSGATVRAIQAGEGVNLQASWLLPHRAWEPQLRFSSVTPALALQAIESEAARESAVGLARYVNGHRIKMNAEGIHGRYTMLSTGQRRGEWTLRFGAEVGI